MKKALWTRTAVSVLAIVGLLAFSACTNDDNPADVTNPGATAPALPDMSTMTMDLSFFGVADIDAASVEKGEPSDPVLSSNADRLNFINAAVRVLFVQLVIYDAFIEPIGAFALAIHSIPQSQPDGSWLWTYIFVEDEMEYSIFLYGKEVDDHVEWRMEVSSNNPDFFLDHFVWFAGESMKDESGGYWQFYMPTDTPPTVPATLAAASTPGVPSIRIDWSHTPSGEHALNILVNDESSPDYGDTVELYNSPSVCWLELNDVSEGETHNITWYADGSGSITVPDYNNGEMACWDTMQLDAVCP